MNPSRTRPDPDEGGYAAWFAFWGQLVILGLLVVVGAFFASEDAAPGDYACGLILSLAALVLAFMRLKAFFDAGPTGWGNFLLVEDWGNLLAVIIVFTILALAGLFIAAGTDTGGLHDGGIALFVTSGLAIFLSLKHVFDNAERSRG